MSVSTQKTSNMHPSMPVGTTAASLIGRTTAAKFLGIMMPISGSIKVKPSKVGHRAIVIPGAMCRSLCLRNVSRQRDKRAKVVVGHRAIEDLAMSPLPRRVGATQSASRTNAPTTLCQWEGNLLAGTTGNVIFKKIQASTLP